MQTVRAHNRVRAITQESPNVYMIERAGDLDSLRVWLCDVYALGIADYTHIRNTEPEINCIVTISGFNSWTREAKHQGYEDEIGVFKFGEFYGALHYDGIDFLHYTK